MCVLVGLLIGVLGLGTANGLFCGEAITLPVSTAIGATQAVLTLGASFKASLGSSITSIFFCCTGASCCNWGTSNPARIAPGGICLAICAASIKKVPLPHIGSNKGMSACHPVNANIPAAKFSLSGAAPFSSRQPRLNKASPEVSK